MLAMQDVDDQPATGIEPAGAAAAPVARRPDPPAALARSLNRGDRIFFAGLAGSAWTVPLLLVLFLCVLLQGAWPAIQAFKLSFLTSSVWEPNPEREQYGAY